MRVLDLELRNFRNYRRTRVELPPGPTVVLGGNAQGKSNLIDALHILATGRSLRHGAESTWVRVDAPASEPFARLAASVRRDADRFDLEMVVARTAPEAGSDSGVRRRVRIGGAARRLIDLPGRLQAVSFAPSDLTLLVGPPADRRRWLDTAIAQVDRSYLEALSGYESLLTRRNALLRRAQAGAARADELAFWDERIAPPALEVLRHRRAYVSELGPIATTEFDRMEGSGAIALSYLETVTADNEPAYTAALRERRARDIERGVSGAGPHRDDVVIELDAHPLGAFASRGQIRLAALAVKFGQFALAERRANTAPVMLLDDITAELDPDHRRLLLSRLRPDVQTLVTTADPSTLDSDSLRDAPRLVIADGAIRSDHAKA